MPTTIVAGTDLEEATRLVAALRSRLDAIEGVSLRYHSSPFLTRKACGGIILSKDLHVH